MDKIQLKILIAPKEKEQLERFARVNGVSVTQTLTGLIQEYNKKQGEMVILELYKRGLLVRSEQHVK